MTHEHDKGKDCGNQLCCWGKTPKPMVVKKDWFKGLKLHVDVRITVHPNEWHIMPYDTGKKKCWAVRKAGCRKNYRLVDTMRHAERIAFGIKNWQAIIKHDPDGRVRETFLK